MGSGKKDREFLKLLYASVSHLHATEQSHLEYQAKEMSERYLKYVSGL